VYGPSRPNRSISSNRMLLDRVMAPQVVRPLSALLAR